MTITVNEDLSVTRCDNDHLDCDMACLGCGRCDSCGVHYADCTVAEAGDWLVDRPPPGEPIPTEADARPF